MDPPFSAAALVYSPALAAPSASTTTTTTTTTTKIRLMCSYGGHIVHRPYCKSLCYVGGETRMVAVDRRTIAGSLSSLIAHLSRVIYSNRPFLLKYQLPNEELDSLVSVTTDEDLQNMLEEHDRIASSNSPTPSRIRLFLFPVKPESLGSALLDPKSESWFSDALNSSNILRKGQSTDSGLPHGLVTLDTVVGSDSVPVEGQAESLSNSGGDAKHGLELSGLLQESLVLETSSSFGSTNSSISMSNLPAIVVHGEESGANLLDKKLRVPSSASIESDISVGSVGFQPKPATYQEPLIQVVSGAASTCTVEPESSISNASNLIQTQKIVQVPAYQVPQQSDGKTYQHGMQYVHGGPYYMPQFPTTPLPISSCYPVYQAPVQQSPYILSQQYPFYLVSVHPSPAMNMSMKGSMNDNATITPNRPILHQGHVVLPPVAQKDISSTQQVPDSSVKVYRTIPITAPVSATSSQGQQQFIGHLEPQLSSQPVSSTSVSVTSYSDEFDDDLSYSQIYKSQPPAPAFISQCQTITKGQ